MHLPLPARYLRLVAPAAVAGVIALVAWVPTLPAGASPRLPALSPQQLLVKAETARVPGLTGTVEWSADLGLPSLGSLGASGAASQGFDPTSLLSGTHQIDVWDSGANQQRLALPRTLGETDLVRHGDQAWVYDSATQKVTHLVPASGATTPGATVPARPASTFPPLTPDQVALRLLDHLASSTSVTVSPSIRVAHRPAYVLSVAPAPGTPGAAVSTVGRITVAVDAATGMPLQVQVFARGQTAPALSIGYSSVNFGVPNASELAVPTGTTEVTTVIGSHFGKGGPIPLLPGTTSGPAGGPRVTGGPWAQVVSFGTTTSAARVLQQAERLATPVRGAFGQARLLQSSLVNVLFLPGGHVLAGFVMPGALEAAAPAG